MTKQTVPAYAADGERGLERFYMNRNPEENRDGAHFEKLGIVKTLFGGSQWRSWLLLPLCLLLCLGMYYAAEGISEKRFDSAVSAADRMEPETRDGRFHFNSITAKEQLLYDALVSAAEKQKPETEILPFPPEKETFEHAVCAVRCDHPELFYIDVSSCEVRTSEHTGAVVMAYYDIPEGAAAALDGTVSALAARAGQDNDYDTALALQKLLIGRTAAGTSTLGAYDALVNGTADGFGYAAAYKLLCNAAGISCEIVTGTAGGGAHAWNCVTADGMTAYCDILWDDCPLDEETIPFHSYFGLTFSEMAKDHTADRPALWDAGDTDMNYYIRRGCAADRDALPGLLKTLLAAADADGEDPYIEFLPLFSVTDGELEELLKTAAAAYNADHDGTVYRDEFHIYHGTKTGNAVTVRLFPAF